jgi:hypothetical protein
MGGKAPKSNGSLTLNNKRKPSKTLTELHFTNGKNLIKK